MQTILVVAILIVHLIQDAEALTFSGCFTLAPSLKLPNDVSKLGWTDKWSTGSLTIQFCVHHCVQKTLKYAGLVTVRGKKSCVCGDEKAHGRLGKPDNVLSYSPCANPIWSMTTYIASGDLTSQYLGCYKEVADPNNQASSSHKWVDAWMMTPNMCLQYCGANGAAYANVMNGDTCTCGYSFAKHGKIPESACNKPCASNAKITCGGVLAHAVYSTLSLDDVLRPSSTVVTHGFQGLKPVNVPITQTLLKNMLDLQQAAGTQVPNQGVRSIGDRLSQSLQLMQSVIDMKQPLQNLAKSKGFGLSNSPNTRKWLVGNFPTQLQSYADVIKRAHSFIDVDLQQLLDYVSSFSARAGPLQAAVGVTLNGLQNYMAKGVLITGIDETIKKVLPMVSASVNCLPLLTSKKGVMVSNLETVSGSLVNGPQGTKHYIQVLKNPFYMMSAQSQSVKIPSINTTAWKDSLKVIANSWFSFVTTHGIGLRELVSGRYSGTPGFGKRLMTNTSLPTTAGPDVDFFEKFRQVGDNKAKTDAKDFISRYQKAYESFNWKSYTDYLDAIYAGFISVDEYLVEARISTPQRISGLTASITDFNFYRPCLSSISTMIETVCHKTSKPNDSTVTAVGC